MPTYVAKQVSSNETASTTLTVTMPSWSVGDIVVVAIAATVASGGSGSISTPTDWEALNSPGVDTGGASSVRVACFYRVMESGDPSSVDFTISISSGFRAIAASYSGVSDAAPINVSGTDFSFGTSGTCPDITTTLDGCMIVRVVGTDDNETLSNGGIDVRDTGAITLPGDGLAIGLGDEEQVSAGPTGTSVWAIGSDTPWGTYTIAIAPLLVDDIAVTDATTSDVQYSRESADAAVVADQDQIDLVLNSATSDAINVVDQVSARTPLAIREISDTVAVVDNVLVLDKDVSDAISVGDQANAQVPLAVREISDTVAVADSIGIDFDREVSDSVTVDDLTQTTLLPIRLNMRVVIAEARQIQGDMDVVVGLIEQRIVSMDLAVTDAPFIKIEPDRPKYAPFLTIDDLETL